MGACRLVHLVAVWAAVLAVLTTALAPTVAQALGRDSGWAMLCTDDGARWVKADGSGDDAPGSPATSAFDHCPYCSLHADAFGLPPTTPRVALVSALVHEVPTLFLAAPRTLHAWRTAQPRAPPAHS